MLENIETRPLQAISIEKIDQSKEFPDGPYYFKRVIASGHDLPALVEEARANDLKSRRLAYANGEYIGTVIMNADSPALRIS